MEIETKTQWLKTLANADGRQPKGLHGSAQLWWKHCHGKAVPRHAEIAFGIYEKSRQKEILEALLLSNCPDEQINTSFGVPLESLALYKQLFFDPAWFNSRLDLIDYIHDYQDAFGKELKHLAATCGYEYVLYKYACYQPSMEECWKIMQRLFLAMIYKALALSAADAIKTACSCARIAVNTYKTLTKNKPAEKRPDLIEFILSSDDPPHDDIPKELIV